MGLNNKDVIKIAMETASKDVQKPKCVRDGLVKEIKKDKKILVISHARWGKDTFVNILNQYFDYTYVPSSQIASDIFIFDILKDKYGYKTSKECFEDRVNHREEWFKLFSEYNKNDKTRLTKEVLKYSNTYIGMRDIKEIEQCRKEKIFDIIVWIDASERLPLEPSNSCNIDKTCADIIIDNNGSYYAFKDKVIAFGNAFLR